MAFVATKSTFVRLWLFAPLLRLGNAQDILNDGGLGNFNAPSCGKDEFECRNQGCIPSENLCDGTADCFDLSDESEFECSKPELICPDYAFRCKYGACIDQDLVCNGQINCVDGSDENVLGMCSYNYTYPTGAAYPSSGGGIGGGTAFGRPEDSEFENISCSVPPHPINGRFKLRRISDNDDIEYIDLPNSALKVSSGLVCICDPGYKIRGNPLVRCSFQGTLTRKPVCIEIRCRPLNSISTMGTCVHASGRMKPCTDDPVRPETSALLSCRPGYKPELSSVNGDIVECKENGEWKPEPLRCVPVCGQVNQESLATDVTRITPFPWHAALYVQGNSSQGTDTAFRCDATIIKADLLLTTAQCVYDFITSWDPLISNRKTPSDILENYFVTTGNTDHDLVVHDSQVIRKHMVKNVHTACYSYRQTYSYVRDVALIELREPLELSDTLLPACLDELGPIQFILQSNSYNGGNRVRGSPTSNQTPQSVRVLDMSPDQCTTLYNATRSPFRINDNEFCNSNNNGIDSCVKDVVNDGGGLVFEVNNVWYLMGIVSQVPTDFANIGRLCDKDLQLLYNKLSERMTWIQQVISSLEHFKYPPCSRYLPPFHSKSTTPVPTSTSMTTPTTVITTTPASTTTSTSSTVRPHLAVHIKGFAEYCLVPPQPSNGEWRLHKDFCESDTHCDTAGRTSLEPGSQLVYSCSSGYKIEGDTNVYCRANGNWSSVPVCIEIRCIPLTFVPTRVTCSRFDEWVDCNYSVLPYTRAKVSCRSEYRIKMPRSGILECDMNGKWQPGIITCSPVCGERFLASRVVGGGEITVAADPWHATLYVQNNVSRTPEKEVRCGATLIQSNLLLTAAHCVYNEKTRTTEDPRKLFILMSNILRQYDSSGHDSHFVRRSTVKNVYVHCNYHGLAGNYVADIALLELQEPLEFFHVQLYPACLDFAGYKPQVHESGAPLEFIGFGKTATGAPSNILQAITLPYVSQSLCKNFNVSREKQNFISDDKLCAGYNNGTAVCLGDGGGGLFIQIDDLWFLMGVVSVDLSMDSNTGGDTCNGNTHVLYTKVSDYMAWILDVMFQLERYKSYSGCS